MPNDYRTRFYGTYLSGRKTSIEPDKLKDLRPRLPYLNKLIQIHFPRDKNASILDLGCGHGALIYIAKQRNVKGIDISPEQVAAKKNCT